MGRTDRFFGVNMIAPKIRTDDILKNFITCPNFGCHHSMSKDKKYEQLKFFNLSTTLYLSDKLDSVKGERIIIIPYTPSMLLNRRLISPFYTLNDLVRIIN